MTALLLRALLRVYTATLRRLIASRSRKRVPLNDACEILLTGTFYSDNWIRAHVQPLAMSKCCRRLRFVATRTLPPMTNVEVVIPPAWLMRLVGGVSARLVVFFWLGVRTKPHIVGGFHLLVNGLVASLLAPIVGARSVYFCGGGPREVVGGGYNTESRIFRRLERPDPVIEQLLLDAVATFDLVIAMGSGAKRFFQSRGVRAPIAIISGGLRTEPLSNRAHPRDVDLILVARLSAIKRVDLFLRAVQNVRRTRPETTAVVVGDGPLRMDLEQFAHDLGLGDAVRFTGHHPQPADWMKRAKIFALTSEAEGVSLALMEAMSCGLPAVVPRIGDLSDVVENGVNGFLVPEGSPEAFADAYAALLTNPTRLATFAHAARLSAARHDVRRVSETWDAILAAARNP